MDSTLILLLGAGYVAVLFAVAYYGDERADRGRSLVNNPYIYALSLAVYCTAWTFYGSVGRAATTGVGFLPIYVGPTLVMLVGWVVLRKIIRISKYHRLTSLADFVGSRYGKSARLAGLVTFVAVLGIVPYIALQLKAISTSYAALAPPSEALNAVAGPVWTDAAFWSTLALAAFTILFGTRHLDVTERHEGLVVAIAFESVVKLVAFLAVGAFVTFGLYDGFGDLFEQGAAVASIRRLFVMDASAGAYGEWFWLTGLSMFAILFLPRQFQLAVVENVNERHLRTATWLFPLYLLAINLFVLPIAVAGLLRFGGPAHADAFVLTLPLDAGHETLALLAFIGGLSAATSMVIVAAIALSTMICNDLVMPVLLRIPALKLAERRRLTGLLLGIRRVSIVGVLLLGYLYLRTVANAYSLVSIGLISFAAVAQFAPAMLGGIYWKRGTRQGATAGLVLGTLLWGYTLPLPSLVETGWLPASFVTDGPFGVAALKPYALFGLADFHPVPHALFWSLLANTAAYVGGSMWTRPTALEQRQAALFVDVFRYADDASDGPGGSGVRGPARVDDLRGLLRRYLGWRRADRLLVDYARRHDLDAHALRYGSVPVGAAPNAVPDALTADDDLVQAVETWLAGAIGAASARVVVSSVAQEKPLQVGEVIDMLDEAQQVIAYSRELELKKSELEHKTAELERKKAELERTTHELRAVNATLKEVDRMKDDFVSTVSHELRTPLAAIRSISEILHANPTLDADQRRHFLETIIREGERLTRLVNQVLDLQRLEADPVCLDAVVDLRDVVRDAADAMRHSMDRDGVALGWTLPDAAVLVSGDRDRLMQVLLNLLSNAAKFGETRVDVHLRRTGDAVEVAVVDDGPGIDASDQAAIFEKFRQARTHGTAQPGSGLGLAIAEQIVHQHEGDLWVESAPGHGATFAFRLPPSTAEPSDAEPSEGEPSDSDGVLLHGGATLDADDRA